MPRTTARRNSNGSRSSPGAYPTNSAVKAELNAGGLPTAAPKGRDAKRRVITRPGVFARAAADCCTAAASAAANRCFLARGVMTRSSGTVVFANGKESGPWGSKITAMAAVVRDLRWAVESIDYRGLDDPGARVRKLIGLGKDLKGPLVLVGSSMGGHVSAAAASELGARGLFLLAPAFYMAGFGKETAPHIAPPPPPSPPPPTILRPVRPP